jgi:hypothetical protein
MSGLTGPWYLSAQRLPVAFSHTWADEFTLRAPAILALTILELWCLAVPDDDRQRAVENDAVGV